MTGRVVDNANLLPPQIELDLSRKLASLEERTARQFVVVSVSSLGDRDIATYATSLGNTWGIGRADHDDGVILLVAPHEQKVRIAVGDGLETTLTDAMAAKIIHDEILPHFRRRDFPAGISAGAEAIIRRLS